MLFIINAAVLTRKSSSSQNTQRQGAVNVSQLQTLSAWSLSRIITVIYCIFICFEKENPSYLDIKLPALILITERFLLINKFFLFIKKQINKKKLEISADVFISSSLGTKRGCHGYGTTNGKLDVLWMWCKRRWKGASVLSARNKRTVRSTTVQSFYSAVYHFLYFNNVCSIISVITAGTFVLCIDLCTCWHI